MNNEKIENILKNLGTEKVPEDIQQIAKEASDNFSKQLSLSQKHKQQSLLELIMKSNLTKLAAAAAIILAVFIVFNQFDRSSIAFADMLQNIQNARTLTYQSFIQYSDQEPLFMNTMVLEPYLMRVELPDGRVWILDHNQGKTLVLDTVKKEAAVSSTIQTTLGLYDMFQNFRDLHNFDVSQIEQQEIDGIRALAFQLTRRDNGDLTIVWANPQTMLPIRIESTVKDNNGNDINIVTTNIIFNKELDKSLFQLEIPEGYSQDFINGPQERASMLVNRIRSAKNMQSIILACMTYAQDNNDQWPDSLQEIPPHRVSSDTLINPSQPERENGYIYIKPGTPISPQQVVLYEAYDSWGDGINVGYTDGHVQFIKEEATFNKELQELNGSM
jgi:prepilin-type processing-associated H-X9-DG protein